MPKLIRQPPNEAALDKLREIYLLAESNIIREIGRLRSRGLVDYHAVAALERIQKILQTMIDDCWTYTPRMVEQQFYVRVPEARKILEPVEKHIAGYQNAQVLTSTQMSIVDTLVTNLMAEVTEAAQTAQARLQDILIGPLDDRTRTTALEFAAQTAAEGKGVYKALPEFVAALRRDGVIAFTDRAGRDWSLHTYCSMCARTTYRQAETLAVITAEESHDLYQISAHGTTCGLCAPFEGRVYSRSGTDPDFPPLSVAFGKVDPDGTDDLTNTYLNIHPNCLHLVLPWTPAGRTPEEIQKIKDFSNPAKNPFSVDPRTKKQIEAYRKKEKARKDWLRDYRQWERYKMTLGDKVPQTFETFQRHKLKDDEKYRKWLQEYRRANRKA